MKIHIRNKTSENPMHVLEKVRILMGCQKIQRKQNGDLHRRQKSKPRYKLGAMANEGIRTLQPKRREELTSWYSIVTL